MGSKTEDLKLQKAKIKIESKTWTKDETNTLLNRMMANLSKSDTQKYTRMLDKLKWDKVAFDAYTAGECKDKWNTISREVRKYRTLTELLNDAKEYLRDPYKGQIKKHPDYPKRPLTPYFRFFMEKRDAFASKHKEMTNLEVTAELSKKYRALPAKKKERYVTEWKSATAEYQIAMKKFKDEHPDYFAARPNKPTEPRTPGVIFRDEYYEEYAKKHPNASKKECYEALRKKYKSLTDEKRQQYIEKALKEQHEHKIALDKFLLSNPDVHKKEKVILNKYERKLNDKKMGKPEKPPSNGYNLFCTEMMPQLKSMLSQKRIVECGKLWNQKTPAEKQEFHDRYIKMKLDYEENVDKYNQKLTPEECDKKLFVAKTKKQKQIQSPSIKMEIKEEPCSDDESDSDDVPLEEDSSDAAESEEEEEDEVEYNEEESGEEQEEANEQTDLPSSANAPARPTTPISALFLYQKANRKKIESQYPTMSPDELTRLLARRYNELPEHKRHKYLQKEKEQRAIYNEKMQEFLKKGNAHNGIEPPPIQLQAVTGEQLYHEKYTAAYCKKFKNDKKQVEAALRVAWSKLSKARKEPFIKNAHELNEKNIAAYNEAIQKQNAAKVETKRKPILPPDISVSQKKIKIEGAPKKPPVNGYQLFSATHINKLSHLSQSEKFKEIGRLWKNLDDSKKATFNAESKKLTDKYKNEIEIWLKKLPKEAAEQFLAQQAKKRTKKGSVNPTAAKKLKLEAPPANQEESDDSSDDTDDSDSSSSDESDDGEGDSSSDSSDSDSDEDSSDSDSDDDDDSSSSQSE
uniref:Nucleolar transcription factor 1 n=1 Tax=Phallusia mammillata TaxID=59560 RepID=A0A6F9DWX5_9ASCI|nr:Nucleolar transcription factor 1 [Phallusia mammillata]